MKRRGFLQALGAAPIVGPAIAEQAAKDAMSPISAHGITANIVGGAQTGTSVPCATDWGERLARHLGISQERLNHNRRTHYFNGTLDAGVASMRSVALHRKIEMSRDIDFQRKRHNTEQHLRLGTLGWWDDENRVW